MRKALKNENTDLVRMHPDYVERVVSDEGKFGRSHLDDFQDPEKDTPVILDHLADADYGCGRADLPEYRAVQADQLDEPISSRSSGAARACWKNTANTGLRSSTMSARLNCSMTRPSMAIRCAS